MLKHLKFSLIVLTCLSSAPSLAGVVNGGGGQGVVCRNLDQSVRSVELLDLWEGRELYNRPLLSLGGNLAEKVDTALVALSKSYPTLIKDSECENQTCILKFLRGTAKEFLEPNARVRRLRGVRLKRTDDAMEIAQPENCAIEQIVNYQPGRGLRAINQDLFERLDETNQAALIAHEAYYKFLRDWAGETNSLRTRRAVSATFAGEVFHWPAIFDKKGVIECAAPPTPREGAIPTLGTVIRITPDLKQIFFSTVDGAALIAEGVQAIQGDGLAGFFKNTCGEQAPSNYTYNFDFAGPIEFDRTITLQQSCEAAGSKHYLMMRSPGSAEIRTTALECRERN